MEFLILALATWRLTNLLVDDNEDGPYGVLHSVRHLLGVRYDEKSRRYAKHEFGKIFNCMWCASLWISLLMTAIYYLLRGQDAYHWGIIVFFPLALSALSLLLDRRIKLR